ncbi:MAG: Maf family nucleotide pyrophosphatase [Rhodospirillales bacterium]
MRQYQSIVLASGSASRRQILSNVGLAVDIVPASIDEIAIRRAMLEDDPDPAALAVALADAKAANVAMQNPQHPVIGADQILICHGERFDKVDDLGAAHRQLARLQGRTHELISAVTLHQGANVLWSTTDTARLAMRALGDKEISRYLERTGPAILGSVGCYHLEGKGAWLFDRVEGDFFTVLGLPLLPLLETLRRLGIVG